MAATRISNIVAPEVFAIYGSVNSLAKDVLVKGGIAVQNAKLQQAIMGGGNSIVMPYFKALTYSEPNASSDDPASSSSPLAHGTEKDIAFKQPVNQSWATMDLADDQSGEIIVDDVVAKVEQYWQEDRQRRYVNTAQGLVLESMASHSDDMVEDITAATGDSVVTANLINATAVINATATMGDVIDALTVMAVHSTVYTNMRINDLIDYKTDSETSKEIPYYMGMKVLVDDSLFTLAYGSPAKVKYTSLIFGQGAFGVAAGSSAFTATAYEQDESAGDGAGMETLYSRRQWIIHPFGYTFVGANMAGNAPTLAELAAAANWTRNGVRKSIKIAALLSNG